MSEQQQQQPSTSRAQSRENSPKQSETKQVSQGSQPPSTRNIENERKPSVNHPSQQQEEPISIKQLRRPEKKLSGIKDQIQAAPASNANNQGNQFQHLIQKSPSSSQRYGETPTKNKGRSQSNLIQSNQFLGGSSQLTMMSNYNSASTLRFTSANISFPKAQRFLSVKTSHLGSTYDLPSQRGAKTTTFGFGEKRIIPVYLERNAIEVPSPSKYASHSRPGSEQVSRSFGLPYKFYAKTYIPKITIKEPEASREIPGVGTYEVAEQIAQQKLKYSMLGKGRVFSDLFPSCSPPCNLYSPIEKLVQNGRFTETTFGFGNKYDFTKSNKVTPGPGTYVLPSAFDKFNKSTTPRIKKPNSTTPFLLG